MRRTPDQKLDKLFVLLRYDSPMPLDNEIATLIHDAATDPSIHTHIKQPGRKFIMTTIIIVSLLSAVSYFTLSINPTTSDKAEHFNFTTNPHEAALAPFQHKQEKFSSTTLGTSEPTDTVRTLPFPKTQLTLDAIKVVEEEQFARLGIRSDAKGSIILEENYTSNIIFPIDTFARFKEGKSEFGIPFELFPKFVTDTRGNLIMIGERKSKSRYSKITLLANMPSVLPELNYYRIVSSREKDGWIDSTTVPPTFTKSLQVTVGIMTLDTIISYRHEDKQTRSIIFNSIIERLAAKDSLYKIQFGGEKGLKKRFANAYSTDNLSTQEHAVKLALDSIESLPFSKLEKMGMQFSYLGNKLKSPNYSNLMKLKLEQLHRSIDYQYYVLQHNEDEKKLEKIDSYLPLLIRQSSGLLPDNKYDNGLIFWYEPTVDLLTALPTIHHAPSSVNTEDENLQVYPNPAEMYLFFNYRNDVSSVIHLELRDLLGNVAVPRLKVYNTNGSFSSQIDVSSLTSGIYFLVGTLDNGHQFSRRVIVE